MQGGGFGNNPAAFGAFGMNQGMDNIAAQRAMLEAAQAGQMQQMNQSGGAFNVNGYSGGGGGGLGNLGGAGGGAGGSSDWLSQSFGRSDQDNKDDEQGYRGQV